MNPDVEQQTEVIKTGDGTSLNKMPYSIFSDSYDRLSDSLWPPFKLFIFSPKDTFSWWCVTNFVFVAFGETNWALAYFFTIPGLVAMYMVGLYFAALLATRSIAYPMSNRMMLRGMEKEFSVEQQKMFLKSLFNFRKLVSIVLDIDKANAWNTRSSINILNQSINACDTHSKKVLQPLLSSLQSYNEYLQSKESITLVEQEIISVLFPFCTHLSKLLNCHELLRKSYSVNKDFVDEFRSLLALELLSGFLTGFSYNDDDSDSEKTMKIIEELSGKSTLEELQQFMNLHQSLLHVYNKKKKQCNCENCRNKAILEGQNNDSPMNEKDPLLAPVQTKKGILDVVKTKVKGFYGDFKSANKQFRAMFNIDFSRHDLLVKYNALPVDIPSKDGTIVQGLFFSGANRISSPTRLSCTLEEFKKEFEPSKSKCIIVCNPNAAMYEYSRYSFDWLDFYLDQNINVFMFNYRGYGSSEGYPSPHKLHEDGEAILNFLLNNCLVTKGSIGVHATSIGGIVAAKYISQFEEFGITLCIFDRNFSSLSNTASALVHRHIGSIVGNVLGWEGDNVSFFLQGNKHNISAKSLQVNLGEAEDLEKGMEDESSTIQNVPAENVYCVVACDPEDEIIHNNASLKVGVARNLMEHLLFSKSMSTSQRCGSTVFPCNKASISECEASDSILSEATFSYDFVLIVLSIQSKLQMFVSPVLSGMPGSPVDSLSIAQKRSCNVLLETFKSMLRLQSCGIFLEAAIKSYLASHALNTLEKARDAMKKKMQKNLSKQAVESDDIRDWFYSFVVWQSRIRFMDDQKSFISKMSAVANNLRRLRVNDIELIELLEVSSEVSYLEKVFLPISSSVMNQAKSDEKKKLFLLPLTCGHNGGYKSKEAEAFVKHLASAGWIKAEN